MTSLSTHDRAVSDRGFTLVELIVVVLLLGITVGALSNAIIVVLRTHQGVTERLDDNRDLLNLATWLPQDVNSTPAGTTPGTGIEAGNLPSGCATTDVGVGLLRLTWTEQVGNLPTRSYRVSYRAVTDNTTATAVVTRVACENLGAPKVSNASKALPLMTDLSLPVRATVNAAGTVVLSVVQHPGTPEQRTIKIEADSKNPGAALLPEPPPIAPKIGTLTGWPETTPAIDAGNSVSAAVAGFEAGETVTFWLDFTYSLDTSLTPLASVVASGTGTGNATLVIPVTTTKGTHQIFAIGSNDTFANRRIAINNGTLTTSPANVVAGATFTATVDNYFAVGTKVTFKMDDLTVLGELVVANGSGGRSAQLVIPLETTGGRHVVTAVADALGRRAVSDPPIFVTPKFSVSPNSVRETLSTSAVIYGFRAGEVITFRLDTDTGAVLGTAVADVNGSAGAVITPLSPPVSLVIPPFTSTGAHTIVASGDDRSSVSSIVNVAPSVREYKVTAATTNATAGGTIDITLQAMINGAADPDPALNGVFPITVTGPVASPPPNSTPPGAAPTTANFSAGVANISIPVVNAAPTTITVTDGVRTGSSPAVSVKAAASDKLSFAVACPTALIGGSRKWTSGFVVRDLYGNAVAGTVVTLSFNPAVGNSGAVKSLDWTGWTTQTPNVSYRSITDESGNTPSFTATGQNNGTGKNTTVTAQMATGAQKTITCALST